MKRETILFYLKENKVYFYLTRRKKEIVKQIDTSSFLECGEISSVSSCISILNEVIQKESIITGIFKPNINVLYNDVCHCDLEYLYSEVITYLGFNDIDFTRLTWLFKSDKRNIVLLEDCYTVIKSKVKQKNILKTKDMVFVGFQSNFEHFTNEDYVWEKFKTYFTNK